jgi:heme exporter protein A
MPVFSNPASLMATDLTCRRNGRLLFSELSFALKAGQALALTGPNGVGKTSLLRILAGLLRPQSGLLAVSPAAADLDLPQRSIFVSSRDPLKGALTVRELTGGWQRIVFGGDNDVLLTAALDAFELGPLGDVPCGYLSSGQRRRVSLARLKLACVQDRPLWLLDEPTNALDQRARDLLTDVVAAHLLAGGMVVAATHDPLPWPDLTTLDLGEHNLVQPWAGAGA